MNIKPTFTEFGGRPLTSAELAEILDIERRRERLAWLRRMILVLIIGAIVVGMNVSGYKSYSERLVMTELMYAPEDLQKSYSHYSDIELYNSVSGTDFSTVLDIGDSSAEYMSGEELMKFARVIYSTPASERKQYVPEYTFEQFCDMIAQLEVEKRAEVYERTADQRMDIARVAAAFGGAELLLLVLLLICPGALYLSRQELTCRSGRMWVFQPFEFTNIVFGKGFIRKDRYLLPRCCVDFCAGTKPVSDDEDDDEVDMLAQKLPGERSDGKPYIRQGAKIRRNLFTIAERRRMLGKTRLRVLIVMVKGRIKLYPQ